MKSFIPFFFTALTFFTACSLLGSDDEDNRPAIPGKIVFSAEDDNGSSQIFTMNANGADLRQITHLENDEAYQPSWSPDGTQIVFSTSLRSSSNGFSLYLMNADGSNMRALNERKGSDIPTPGNNPQWSPDGSKIVYDFCVNCQLGTNLELFVYDFETEEVIRLTDNQSSESNPAWSPDGRRIAFTSNRDYFDADTLRFRSDLYVMDVDGTNLKRLTESGFSGMYRWINSENVILTTTDKNTNLKDILKLNIESGNKSPLKKNLQIKRQFWVFINSVNQQLFTINKNHEELPVIITTYDMNGKQLQQVQLNSSVLKTAIGFDFFINAQN